MAQHSERFRRRALVRKYAEKRVDVLDVKQWEKDMERWSELDFSRSFTPDDQRIPDPAEEVIQEVLKIIGREERAEEINCGACGYKSCREFAVNSC